MLLQGFSAMIHGHMGLLAFGFRNEDETGAFRLPAAIAMSLTPWDGSLANSIFPQARGFSGVCHTRKSQTYSP